MDATRRIEEIITPSVGDMGYEIVRVQLSGAQQPVLQIMAERIDGGAMTVEDCADISRAVSALLDVEDPIASAYTLEVSSPGIDRPLTRLQDYADWAGHEARITLHDQRGGRKQFSGTLEGLDGDSVKLTDKSGQPHALPFSDIASAKLLLTNKLINATAPLSTEGAETIQTIEE
jgi:ribosome maturation factor RimP